MEKIMLVHNDGEYMATVEKWLELYTMKGRTVGQQCKLELQYIAIGEYEDGEKLCQHGC